LVLFISTSGIKYSCLKKLKKSFFNRNLPSLRRKTAESNLEEVSCGLDSTYNRRNLHTDGTGTTVLEAARQAGIRIPTLCHLADLSPEGACRVCVVKIEGMRTLTASCVQPVAAGMVIHTHTAEVLEARRWSWNCCWPITDGLPACARNLNCELQTLAADLGVKLAFFRPTAPLFHR
jgi:predicted molibdopterin-dependent oxidoreductase YjgC